ncbi:unnamed protein product, partial [Heterosigma akashiwo]
MFDSLIGILDKRLSFLLIILLQSCIIQLVGTLEIEVTIDKKDHKIVLPQNQSATSIASEFCLQHNIVNVGCTNLLAKHITNLWGDKKAFGEAEPREEDFVVEWQHDRAQLVFLHLKKCGGTTVEQFLFEPSPLAYHRTDDLQWFF